MRNEKRLLAGVLSCALMTNLVIPVSFASESQEETPKVAHSDYLEGLIADWKANNDISRPESNIYGSGLNGVNVVGHVLDLETAESAGNVIYLKDTEAQPDDGICDRDIIQALISEAEYGTVILFEEGQYDLILPESDSTANAFVLKDGVSLVGSGMSDIENTTGTRLKLDATANTSSTIRFFYGTGVTNFTISDMTLDSKFTGEYPDPTQPAALQATISGRNSGEMTHGIYLDASGTNPCEFITIENVSVETFRTYAINIRNTNNVVIRGCAFQYATNMGGGGAGYGVAIQGTTDTDRHGLPYDSYHNVVEECMILGPVLRHGILIQYYSHNNLIHNNLLYGTGYGAIDMHGEEEYLNEISHNVIDGINHGGGIEVGNSGSGHHRTGPLTYVHDNTISNSRRGIDVEFGTHDTIVENNTITDLTGGLLPYDGSSGTGIRLRHNYRTIIRNNTVSGDFKYGIVLESHYGYTYTDSTNDGGAMANFGGGISHQADIYNNTVTPSNSLTYTTYANDEGKTHTNNYNYTYSSSEYHDNYFDTVVEENVPYFEAPYYIGTGIDNTFDVDVSDYIVVSSSEMLMPEEVYTPENTLISQSNNAHLVALVLETEDAQFTHPFFPEYQEHTLNTTKSTLALTPYASAHNITSIEVNENPVESGKTALVDLTLGENVVEITVIAEDGTTVRTYTLTANYLSGNESAVTLKSATASHESTEENVASNVIDGNPYTYWRADLSESEGTSDIIVELSEETEVSHVNVAWFEGTSYEMDFKIYTSTDNSTWTEGYSATNSTGYTEDYVTYVLNDEISAKYVKLEVSKLTEFDPDDINNSLRLNNKNNFEDQVSVRGIQVLTSGETLGNPEEISFVSGDGVEISGELTGNSLKAEVIIPDSALGETGKVAVKLPVTTSSLPSTAVATMTYENSETEVVTSTIITENGIFMNLKGSGSLVIADNKKLFDDVADTSWYAETVDFVASRHLFTGTDVGVFSPTATMNHAMFRTVLYSFDGAKVEAEGSEWYAKAVLWANDFTEGFDDVLANVTREEMVTILYRYVLATTSQALIHESFEAFHDADSVSDFAVDAMAWAVANGVVSGDDTGAINPQGTATRAEAATIFTRFAVNFYGM